MTDGFWIVAMIGAIAIRILASGVTKSKGNGIENKEKLVRVEDIVLLSELKVNFVLSHLH